MGECGGTRVSRCGYAVEGEPVVAARGVPHCPASIQVHTHFKPPLRRVTPAIGEGVRRRRTIGKARRVQRIGSVRCFGAFCQACINHIRAFFPVGMTKTQARTERGIVTPLDGIGLSGAIATLKSGQNQCERGELREHHSLACVCCAAPIVCTRSYVNTPGTNTGCISGGIRPVGRRNGVPGRAANQSVSVARMMEMVWVVGLMMTAVRSQATSKW